MVRQSTCRRSFLRAAGGVALASSAPAWLARDVRAGPADGRTVALMRAAAEPLPELGSATFGHLFDRFADAQVVLLGEETHGTSEFYRARAAITERLVKQHGFTIVAAEADWPEAAKIDRYIRHGRPLPPVETMFSRFPSWMWRNEEVWAMAERLRAHNATVADPEARAGFYGLDLYSLRPSSAAVLAYLDEVDPGAAALAREHYACLQNDGFAYARLSRGPDFQSCEGRVGAVLDGLLAGRDDYLSYGPERFFDAAQNARVVAGAEQYYRRMDEGRNTTWNLRDQHMFDTLVRLLKERGPGAKAVVWAHNSHIGNAAATDMGRRGQFNIGELCREHFGDRAVAIGFGTDRGTVAAASHWDRPMEVKEVRPAHPESYGALCRETGLPASLLDVRAEGRDELRDVLSEPRLERFIGVIYRPETELVSHYSRAELARQFDAYVWFEQTRAVRAIAAGAGQQGRAI